MCYVSRIERGGPRVETKTIEAQEFVLRDGEGRERAVLGLHPDSGQPFLQFFDQKEKLRMSLSLNDRGEPWVSLRDGEHTGLAIELDESGSGTLAIYQGGRLRALIGPDGVDLPT